VILETLLLRAKELSKLRTFLVSCFAIFSELQILNVLKQVLTERGAFNVSLFIHTVSFFIQLRICTHYLLIYSFHGAESFFRS